MKKDWEKEFCNDHGGEIRFLRSIFFDEKDGAEEIMNFIGKLQKSQQADIKKMIERIESNAGHKHPFSDCCLSDILKELE